MGMNKKTLSALLAIAGIGVNAVKAERASSNVATDAVKAAGLTMALKSMKGGNNNDNGQGDDDSPQQGSNSAAPPSTDPGTPPPTGPIAPPASPLNPPTGNNSDAPSDRHLFTIDKVNEIAEKALKKGYEDGRKKGSSNHGNNTGHHLDGGRPRNKGKPLTLPISPNAPNGTPREFTEKAVQIIERKFYNQGLEEGMDSLKKKSSKRAGKGKKAGNHISHHKGHAADDNYHHEGHAAGESGMQPNNH
jgi:hypothetical protein